MNDNCMKDPSLLMSILDIGPLKDRSMVDKTLARRQRAQRRTHECSPYAAVPRAEIIQYDEEHHWQSEAFFVSEQRAAHPRVETIPLSAGGEDSQACLHEQGYPGTPEDVAV
jgi:hypothetical protein